MIEYVPQLTQDAARRMAAVALAEAERIACGVAVAVVDAGGRSLLLERTPGARPAAVEIARGKAECAVAYGIPTAGMAEAARAAPALAMLPRSLPFPGGVPVIVDGRVAGAIGVSGALADQDVACAEAGVAALGPMRADRGE